MVKYIIIFIVIWAIMFPVVGSGTGAGFDYEPPSYGKATLIISAFLALLGTAFIYCAVNHVY